jgi:uncharacterized CHY-type Zn-finger protein
MELTLLAAKCRIVYKRAAEQLGDDLAGHSVLDLLADNFPQESLRALEDAMVVAGLGALRPHKVVCAWCKKVLSEGREPISHGICPECKAEMKKEIAEQTK